MKKGSLKNLFISELEELIDAERQLVEALPNMVKAAEEETLKTAFKTHLEETKNQVERLNQIFTLLQTSSKGKTCEAMQELIQECSKTIQEYPKSALRDAALITKAQCIEHYEISIYGTLRTFAKELGMDIAQDLLQENLDEEANADKTLTKIAEGSLMAAGVNQKANGKEKA